MHAFYNVNHCEFWLKNIDFILEGPVLRVNYLQTTVQSLNKSNIFKT